MEENFGGSSAPASAAKPGRRAPARDIERPSLRRTRRIGGFGMFFLAAGCMGGGAWAGTQVQAYAVGEIAHAGDVNPAQVISTGKGPAFTF